MKRINFSKDWMFYYGELQSPPKTVRKAAAIGGYTSVLEGERGDVVPVGAGGHHFLKLISGGNETMGLMMLAGTVFGNTLKDWKKVDLPHDWKSELSYTEDPRLLMSGSKEDGIGYYRKCFSLGEEVKGKKVTVYFEGTLRSADVWFNGCYLGQHLSGYTSFSMDLTDLAHYGEEGDNVLLVRVDTTTGAEGWWYEGAGIYRNVYLEIREKLHVGQWGIHARTAALEENKARIEVITTLVNDDYEAGKLRLKASVSQDAQELMHTISEELTVEALEHREVILELVIPSPKLWSTQAPELYRIKVEILTEDKTLDWDETTYGIRTVEYTQEGLFLNGIRTEIKGVCEHQDFAGIGTALTGEILRYKLQQMKAMGVNAYRSAHHAATPELLDLCDELGILVMEENRVLESSELRLQELKDMIQRDRNHPSIIFWSLCNEEVIGSTPMADRMAGHMAAVIRKMDLERLIVSAELLNPEGIMNPGYMKIFDVVGVNYPESPVMGGGLDRIRQNYPQQKLMSTENASFFSTRGIYEDHWENCHTSNYGSCFSIFGREPLPPGAPGVGGTAHPETVMDFFKTHPFMGGSFIWTALDYCGEPSPFPWPAISSQFGIMDTCGFPKDYFYYYQSKWGEKPMIHALPHWNWKGREGQPIEVRIFSNCEEAEVILNGISLGRKSCEEHYTTWQVPFKPGELLIHGYRNNELVASEMKHTTEKAVRLALRRLGNQSSNLQMNETALVEIYALDAEGYEIPDADNQITVEVSEAGKILGLGNGNPGDHTPNKAKSRRLFSGKLLCVVQAAEVGCLKIKATTHGLEQAALVLEIQS